MIGIVLVSHSTRLANGVVELMSQMGGEDLRIAVAAGLEQPRSPLGTDAVRVARAIDEVWSEEGVLVLMDLGSSVLSAEMALDLIADERRARVLLTAAPLVEGAVAAAVAAGLNEPLDDVAREARGGLAAKIEHLGAERDVRPTVIAAGAPGVGPSTETQTLRFTVVNPLGLHARPAAALVRAAAAYEAEVTVSDVTTGRGPASAHSLNAVATLGVLRGDVVEARASGPQAQQALASIRELADRGFGEPDVIGSALPDGNAAAGAAEAGVSAASEVATATDVPAAEQPAVDKRAAPLPEGPAQPAAGSVLAGLPASAGMAIGVARGLHPVPLTIPDGPGEGAHAEWHALQRALAATADDIRRAAAAAAGHAGDYEAAIFDAHALFLGDEVLLEPARREIAEDGQNAAKAWTDAVSTAGAAWEALDDPYQRARVADLRSVGDQVVRHLLGRPAGVTLTEVGIAVATDLTPAQTAALDRSLVRGIACAGGAPTSHSAILARSFGIPAVVALGEALLAVPEGTRLVLDGEAGTVTVDPSPDSLQ
ncbi:MAG TPA: dihydroxyacetone kinase phosphoryl donor subunit DhaM, partial [Thermoleophilia bacterium]|nr:dihydroxyacetone kinase phosphoryl donor subunit DhaM [Thermoleophilia bacterium]